MKAVKDFTIDQIMSLGEIMLDTESKATGTLVARSSTGSVCRRDRKFRIGLISPYTGDNLGDSAIIESARGQLLRTLQDAEFLLLVLDPSRVSELHSVEAFQLAAVRRKFYFTPPTPPIGGAVTVTSPSGEKGASSIYFRARSLLKRLVGHIPLGLKTVRSMRDGLQLLTVETRHLFSAHHTVGDLDALIVAGGGQFDDLYGGPWGHPYAMLKWITLARSRGVPVFLVGVGVDDLHHPLSCWFLRRAVAKVDRVSLRDAGSIEVLRRLKVRRELISCVDLAFGLPTMDLDPLFKRAASTSSTMIGLSPVAFGRPGSWPTAAEELFERYWSELHAFADSLIQSNYSITLFATDGADYPLAQMLYNRLTADSSHRDRVQLLPWLKLQELLAALRKFDAVVASRLHGVLLSHLCGVPALAISYRRKVTVHMEDMGHERFCLEFGTYTASEALQGLNALLADRETLVAELGRACADRYETVENEFAAISADLSWRSAPVTRQVGKESGET